MIRITGIKLGLARRLVAFLAIVGFAVRVMMPVGFMPEANADGAFFVPCPAQHPGLQALQAHLGGHTDHHHDHGHSHGDEASASTAMGDCSFSTTSPTMAAVPSTELAAKRSVSPLQILPEATSATSVDERLYRPRGPPGRAFKLS